MSTTTDAIIAKSNKVRAEQHAKLLSEFIHATNEFVFVSLEEKTHKSVRAGKYPNGQHYYKSVRRQTPKYLINIRYDANKNKGQYVPNSIHFLGRYINNELTKASRRKNRLGKPKYFVGREQFALDSEGQVMWPESTPEDAIPNKITTCSNMTITLTRREHRALSKYVKEPGEFSLKPDWKKKEA